MHAPLGEVEWPGTIEHIQDTIPDGVPFILAPVASGRSLLERIEERGMFPSASVRWCTSNFKRTPIERELRRYLKAHPRFGNRIVSAMGMRASESPARSKRAAWQKKRPQQQGRARMVRLAPHPRLGDRGRIPNYPPGRAVTTLGLRRRHVQAQLQLLYPRLSRRSRPAPPELRPNLYRRYADLEKRIGHTLSPTRVPLPELTGVPVASCRHGTAAYPRQSRPTPTDESRFLTPAPRPTPPGVRCALSGRVRPGAGGGIAAPHTSLRAWFWPDTRPPEQEPAMPDGIAADYSLKPSELADTLSVLVEARQPAMIWGPPGCAKSQIAQQVASLAKRIYVDVRALLLDRVDLMGIPWRDPARPHTLGAALFPSAHRRQAASGWSISRNCPPPFPWCRPRCTNSYSTASAASTNSPKAHP